MAPVPGRPAARGTWHVPPRESLQKVVDAPTGQTDGTTKPILAGHTYTTPTCVLLWLPFLCGAGRRLHAPGEENFFDMGSSGLRKL